MHSCPCVGITSYTMYSVYLVGSTQTICTYKCTIFKDSIQNGGLTCVHMRQGSTCIDFCCANTGGNLQEPLLCEWIQHRCNGTPWRGVTWFTKPVASRVYCCAAIVMLHVCSEMSKSKCRALHLGSPDAAWHNMRVMTQASVCAASAAFNTCCIYTTNSSSSHHCLDMKIEATPHIYRPCETRSKINV